MKAEADYNYITDYLAKVVALERSVYAQTQTIAELDDRIDELGHPVTFQKPVCGNYATLENTGDFSSYLYTAGLGAVIGGIVGIFTGGIIRGALIGAAILFFGVLIFQLIENATYNKEVDNTYKSELNWYVTSKERDKRRVAEELNQKGKLIEIKNEISDQRDETASVLELFYSKDIIFPKYRNIVAACSIYEYFLAKRCFSLIGHDGAYNIYENEVRLERICTKLDEVVTKLEDIKSNQYMLYDAIQDGNQLSQQLLSESIRQSKIAERTEENTALSAHYAKVAADNAEACAWIGAATYFSIEDGKKH